MSSLSLVGDWSVATVTDAINTIATPNEYLGNTIFKVRKDLISDDFKIPIKRGDNIIMTAISKNAPRPLMSENKSYMINASLARFGEERSITPNDIRGLLHLDNELRILKEADLITQKQKDAKKRFSATLEFMRMGAIKGVINDGEDNKLLGSQDIITKST